MSAPLGIAVLGSTGSVGRQSLEVIEAFPDHFRLVGLAARCSAQRMVEQAGRTRPQVLVMDDEAAAKEVGEALGRGGPAVEIGPGAVEALVQRSDVDLVVAAIVGRAGLPGVMAAVKAGKRVAIANKESLVMAGELLMPLVSEGAARLLPIDSEHAALAQLLARTDPQSVRSLVLTASGGPFLDVDVEIMADARPADALAHPTWEMGAKISIDSATMMNKAFEVIEARWLFDLDEALIGVVVHPESRVHAALKLVDGSWLAQLGPADMRIPIAQALAHPRLLDLSDRLAEPRSLDLVDLGSLTFRAVDETRFPALRLGRQAIAAGRGRPAALCVADEVLVQAFLDGRIGFLGIARGLDAVMQAFSERDIHDLADVLAAGRDGERLARERVAG